MFAFFIVLILLNIKLISVGSNNTDLLHGQEALSKRNDCARQINANQASTRDQATIADRAVNRYFFETLLDATKRTQPVSDDQIKEFGRLLADADTKDRAVVKLPDPAKLVDQRCPSAT